MDKIRNHIFAHIELNVNYLRFKAFYPTLLFALLCILLSFRASADNAIDSLHHAYSITKSDTEKANILHELVVDLTTIGHYPQADSLQAIELNLSQKNNFKKGLADAILNRGIIQYYQGNYPEGLASLFNSLKLSEDIDYKHGKASSILYIGYIYEGQGDVKKAMDNFTEASKLFEELKDDDYDATAIINMGNVYNSLLHDYGRALGYYMRSMKLFSKAKDDDGVASALKDIGNMYLFEKDTAEAIESLVKGQNMFKELNDDEGFTQGEISLGNIYLGQKKYKDALAYAQTANGIGKKIGSFVDIRESEKLLSAIYLATKDAMKSLQHYKAYIAAKDSLTNQENTKKSIRAELNFEFEKKQTIAKAEQDKKNTLQEAQARKQRLVIYFISGIVLLFLCIAIFVFRSYLQKQRDNKELDIRNQKIEGAYKIIEVKNHEITDSINYAKLIQHAILPDEDVLRKIIPQCFVLFMPKDIVSGDFYFVKELEGNIFLAAADCTGHGVPGAFMSIIGSEKLHDAVRQSADTAQILQLLNKGIKSSLHQSGSESTRDGMDIALCSIQAPPPPEGGIQEGFGYEMADPILYGRLKEFAKEHRSCPTEAENVFWQLVRAKNMEGYKFRRQHIIGNYIADFVCLSHRIIIEIDGLIHQLPDNKVSDEQRTAYLKDKGFNVLRFTNNDVIGNSEIVLTTILNELKKIHRQIPPSGGGGAVLHFSGANRPLWIIRNSATEIEEIKADKKAIGGFTEEEQGFEKKQVQLNKGDTFYIFSDGYADQFGGEQGKKLSTRKFREILLNIQKKSMLEQKTYLEGFIDSWKAEKEQLDDILVIGVRI